MRIGQRIRLPREHRERYLELHAAVWPGVEATLTAAGVRNYTIFLDGEDLFAFFEVDGGPDDVARALARVGEDPLTREWWTHTDPLQERLPGTPEGEQWKTLTEVWHLD
ncbi:L-rhamnose mutarotase [Nocardioides sp. GY 10127]|uniref:L-rhamnose mutarotase n=1 Tax=Nocardioides sp. GY 10127 TaxID=2569762 RepID=UPI0010A77C18|nr:L-rhamnose mutarotase [Nocardioides sp. GY 10127]TIC79338.1 L-rhamnose mutarotase [Nocardioides sp. GY 10127]